MLLSSYADLIRNLPYLDQAFETKQANWQREYTINESFKDYCNATFKTDPIKLSRRDLFSATEKSFCDGLFSIILWGYPRNMRGNSLANILDSLPQIELAFPKDKHLTEGKFQLLYKSISGTSIGLSTLTKLLYFFQISIDGKRCLIMDRRIIDVINNKMFVELMAIGKITEFNKTAKYLAYITKLKELAKANNYAADQLELFLFLFGKNLKGKTEGDL